MLLTVKFKVDVIFRGLSQLYYCKSFSPINFSEHAGDIDTQTAFKR